MGERLAGKRIAVTGATRGLGRAIAAGCAAEGAVVAVGCREASLADADAVVDAIEGAGGSAVRMCADVGDAAAVGAAVDGLVARWGRIDGWVSNAAEVLPDLLVVAEPDRIERQVRTNLLGPIHCARAVLPAMVRQRGGVLLHVSSVAAVRPSRGQAVYAATKGGVESLTRALAVEYAKKGIRVVCLRPGPVDTDMLAPTKAVAGDLSARVPLGRVATPEEVAAHAVWLLSDQAAFVTGSVHAADGGYSL